MYVNNMPMIHPNLLLVNSRSWEVGKLRCDNIGRDQHSPKLLKLEMRKHRQRSDFTKNPNTWATMAPHLDAIILAVLENLLKKISKQELQWIWLCH